MNHFHFASARTMETIAFYCRYFGFARVRKLGATHVLKGNRNFVLAIDESTESQSLPSPAHLGFTLDSPTQVRELFQALGENETLLLSSLLEPSPRAIHFYCQDPTGNRLEVGWFAF